MPTTTGSMAENSRTSRRPGDVSPDQRWPIHRQDCGDGAEYERIELREANYQTEKIQFYRLVDIPFARELRKVSVHHPLAAADARPLCTQNVLRCKTGVASPPIAAPKRVGGHPFREDSNSGRGLPVIAPCHAGCFRVIKGLARETVVSEHRSAHPQGACLSFISGSLLGLFRTF